MHSKFILIATIIFFLAFTISIGQTKSVVQNKKSKNRKIIFSPPDKIFSIEVPIQLKEDQDTYKEEESIKSIRLFGGSTSKMTFLVYALTYKDSDEDIKKDPKEKLGGMEFVVGGDDDHEFVERFIEVDGFQTREVVYKNQNAKGIMIDAGQQVYILCLAAKNRKDLESRIANRFFSSFRLIRKTKNAIHN